MNHEHMMELDAMLCLPGSIGTPMAELISAGVRTAQESVTGPSGGAAGGVEERQAERKMAAVRRVKSGFVCIVSGLSGSAADGGTFLAGALAMI
jgi:hypothetical protein